MAVDALEYDDEDANPAGAVEEILESPDRLKVKKYIQKQKLRSNNVIVCCRISI